MKTLKGYPIYLNVDVNFRLSKIKTNPLNKQIQRSIPEVTSQPTSLI